MKRALRRAPRAFSLWVLGPCMCARNGVFEELAHLPSLAEALWDWVSLVRSVSAYLNSETAQFAASWHIMYMH